MTGGLVVGDGPLLALLTFPLSVGCYLLFAGQLGTAEIAASVLAACLVNTFAVLRRRGQGRPMRADPRGLKPVPAVSAPCGQWGGAAGAGPGRKRAGPFPRRRHRDYTAWLAVGVALFTLAFGLG